MLNRFHLIPERNEQTDRRTGRFAISISRVSILTRDKKPLCQIGSVKYEKNYKWKKIIRKIEVTNSSNGIIKYIMGRPMIN